MFYIGVIAVLALVAWVGVLAFGRRRTATVIGAVLAVPVVALGALLALLHDYSESAPPPPPLYVENDSHDALYLVWLGADVADDELHSTVRWNGSIRPGATGRAPLGFPDEDGLMCARSRVVLVESISGELRYGSNYLDDDGVRQYPEPTVADLEVRAEWPVGQCFADDERYFRWAGDQAQAVDAPPETLDLPGWIPPLAISVAIAAALIASGWWIDRRRAPSPAAS